MPFDEHKELLLSGGFECECTISEIDFMHPKSDLEHEPLPLLMIIKLETAERIIFSVVYANINEDTNFLVPLATYRNAMQLKEMFKHNSPVKIHNEIWNFDGIQ